MVVEVVEVVVAVVVATSVRVGRMVMGLEVVDESDDGTGVVTPDGSEDEISSVMVLSTYVG